MAKSSKVTIGDIAKYTNISTGTIDRVIHKRGKVSLKKKALVEDAIDELGFNPNFLASTLALGKQFTICTLLPEANNIEKYWALPKIGIEKIGQEYEVYGFVMDHLEYFLFDESSFVKQAKLIVEKNPSGVILAPLFEKESRLLTKELDKKNIPYVFIDANISDGNPISYIGPDSKSSGLVAAKLLDSILRPDDNILVVNMVKGVENSSLVRTIEKGFLDFFKTSDNSTKRKIYTLTIHSTDKSDVVKELTKCYIKNPNIKGVFVTNSRAHLVSDFHISHDLDIRVIGFDVIEENIREMKKGGISFLISQSPIFQGKWAVQTFFNLFVSKKKLKAVHHVPIDIIIKENVDFYLDSF
ncbi:MAG: substrate-binding domain-containing protein [Flavobacteriaceae bacterium]